MAKPLKISATPTSNDALLREARASFEARYIAEVFAHNGGNVAHRKYARHLAHLASAQDQGIRAALKVAGESWPSG